MIPSIFICWGYVFFLFFGICSTGSEDWSNDGDLFLDRHHASVSLALAAGDSKGFIIALSLEPSPLSRSLSISLSLSEFYVWRVM
jgi:hypothetical protein